MKMKTWKKAMLILLMLAFSLIFVSPILLLLNSSFKELKEIYLDVLALPTHFGIDNYREALKTGFCTLLPEFPGDHSGVHCADHTGIFHGSLGTGPL